MADMSPGGAVALGVIVGLLSTSIQSVGLTLQRKSHLLEDEKEDEYARRPPYRRRRWQVGMLMFLIANIVGSSIQITTLPLPVLSTLQASGLVFNTICATLILKEAFTRYSLLGTILVAVGAVLIGIFGAMTEPSHNLSQLLTLLGQSGFIVWLVGTFVLAIAFVAIGWFLNRMQHSVKHITPRGLARIRLGQGMMYGAVSGILSAHSLLVAKSAVELLVRTIVDRHNQFNRWQSWMILLSFVFFAVTQLYYLHLGLRLASTSVLYPFVFCVYNIIAILDGLIYFRQASRLPLRGGILIAVGTVILLAGVVALSWRLGEVDEHERTGTTRRVRSMSRIATPTMPQTVLAPGMGIVEDLPTPPLEAEDGDDALDEREHQEQNLMTKTRNPDDDPHEGTPLLRNRTAPNLLRFGRTERVPSAERRRKRALGTLQPLKTRRTTVGGPGAVQELWDELVEDEGYSRRSSLDFDSPRRPLSGGAFSAVDSRSSRRSPVTVRFKTEVDNDTKHTRRSSTGSALKSGQSSGVSGRRTVSAGKDPQPGDETDASEDVPLLGARSPTAQERGTGQGAAPEGPVEWLRLKWWRQRWRGDAPPDDPS